MNKYSQQVFKDYELYVEQNSIVHIDSTRLNTKNILIQSSYHNHGHLHEFMNFIFNRNNQINQQERGTNYGKNT